MANNTFYISFLHPEVRQEQLYIHEDALRENAANATFKLLKISKEEAFLFLLIDDENVAAITETPEEFARYIEFSAPPQPKGKCVILRPAKLKWSEREEMWKLVEKMHILIVKM